MTYVDDILLAMDHDEEMQDMVNHRLERYGERDLGLSDKLIGVTLMVTDEGTKHDQALNTERIVIEGMCSFKLGTERARTGYLKRDFLSNSCFRWE